MRLIVITALILTLSACVTTAPRPLVPGGQKVTQTGVSFVAPPEKNWSMFMQSTYQVTLGAKGDNPDETFIVSLSTYQIPSFPSPQDFLAYVRSGRAAEPKTGRFEAIKNDEQLYTGRTETCVKHEAESKDNGAKRGVDFTIIDYIGMNCIHPTNPTVGIFIEISRKAPPGIEFSQFKDMGSQLLKSVEFSSYK